MCLLRIAPQRDDMAHPGLPIGVCHLGDFGLAGRDASKVCGGRNLRVLRDARHRVMCALARRPARAIGDGNEARGKRAQRFDALPQLFFHLLRLGRKEFEAHLGVSTQIGVERGIEDAARFFQRSSLGIHDVFRSLIGRTFALLRRPSHSFTVSSPPGSVSVSSVSIPASPNQVTI